MLSVAGGGRELTTSLSSDLMAAPAHVHTSLQTSPQHPQHPRQSDPASALALVNLILVIACDVQQKTKLVLV